MMMMGQTMRASLAGDMGNTVTGLPDLHVGQMVSPDTQATVAYLGNCKERLRRAIKQMLAEVNATGKTAKYVIKSRGTTKARMGLFLDSVGPSTRTPHLHAPRARVGV